MDVALLKKKTVFCPVTALIIVLACHIYWIITYWLLCFDRSTYIFMEKYLEDNNTIKVNLTNTFWNHPYKAGISLFLSNKLDSLATSKYINNPSSHFNLVYCQIYCYYLIFSDRWRPFWMGNFNALYVISLKLFSKIMVSLEPVYTKTYKTTFLCNFMQNILLFLTFWLLVVAISLKLRQEAIMVDIYIVWRPSWISKYTVPLIDWFIYLI